MKFRHIRYVKGDLFIKAKKRFNKFSDLLKFLNRVGAEDSYYSVAKWLNPTRVGRREEEDSFSTVFLGMDILFDIDGEGENLENKVEDAYEKMKELLSYAKGKFEINYLSFSGSKGFHLSCKDPNKYEDWHPKERERKAKEYREWLAEEVEKFGVDKTVLVDTRRIVRIPFTYNWKSGIMSLPIRWKQFGYLDVKFLLKYTPKIRKSLLQQVMTALRRARKSAPRTGGAYYVHAISSTLPKSGKSVLIAQLRRFGKREKRILEKHGIECYSLFKAFGTLFLLSPMVIERKKVREILKELKAINYGAFIKYKHTLLPIGKIYDEDFHPAGEVKVVKVVCKDPSQGSAAHLKLMNLEGGKEFGAVYRMLRVKV